MFSLEDAVAYVATSNPSGVLTIEKLVSNFEAPKSSPKRFKTSCALAGIAMMIPPPPPTLPMPSQNPVIPISMMLV